MYHKKLPPSLPPSLPLPLHSCCPPALPVPLPVSSSRSRLSRKEADSKREGPRSGEGVCALEKWDDYCEASGGEPEEVIYNPRRRRDCPLCDCLHKHGSYVCVCACACLCVCVNCSPVRPLNAALCVTHCRESALCAASGKYITHTLRDGRRLCRWCDCQGNRSEQSRRKHQRE